MKNDIEKVITDGFWKSHYILTQFVSFIWVVKIIKMIVQRKGQNLSPRTQQNSLLPPPPAEKHSFFVPKEEGKRLTIMTGSSAIEKSSAL